MQTSTFQSKLAKIFESACVNSESQFSHFCTMRSNICGNQISIRFSLFKSIRTCKFEKMNDTVLGHLKIPLLVSDSPSSEKLAKAVNMSVPPFFNFHSPPFLKKFLDFHQESVTSKRASWTLPMVRKLAYTYVGWVLTILHRQCDLSNADYNSCHPWLVIENFTSEFSHFQA